VTDEIFTASELAEVRAYRDPLYVAGVVDQVTSVLLAVICLRYVIARLYRWCAASAERIERRLAALPFPRAGLDRIWSGPGWGSAILFAVVLLGINCTVFLPSTFYFDFVHEHRFGLSNETLGAFCWDYAKGFLIQAIALGALAFGMVGLARRLPRWWLIIGLVAAGGLTISAAIDPYRAQVFVDQEPLAPGELRQQIIALLQRAKVDFKEILVEKTLAKGARVQAYFAGQGPTRTIVVNDALLKEFTTAQILAAVAHEAGHVHESRWAGRLGAVFALLGFLFAIEQLFRLSARRRWWGIAHRADVRAIPLILFVFFLCQLVANPISGAVGRNRELAADRYALSLTRDPETFRSMLMKAARVNKMDPDPPDWVVLRGWSHPPIRQRIEAIKGWQQTEGG
jgi:STE24 endopeptidase